MINEEKFELEVSSLDKELEFLEVSDFISNVVNTMFLENGKVPDDSLECFSRLSDHGKDLAFMRLLGTIRGLMEPPEYDNALITC